MNIKSISKIATKFLPILILFSCESHEQKADDAFESYKTKKIESIDTVYIHKEISDESIKKKSVIKNDNIDEYSKFKVELEKKIIINETLIKKIKNEPTSKSKNYKKASSLEKENIELRNQLIKYKDELKLNWDKFQLEIDQKVKNINDELKNLSTNH
jgi:hypothetical protein